jgi:hypothetical protein
MGPIDKIETKSFFFSEFPIAGFSSRRVYGLMDETPAE